jgi:hypothetical protein
LGERFQVLQWAVLEWAFSVASGREEELFYGLWQDWLWFLVFCFYPQAKSEILQVASSDLILRRLYI